MVLKNVPHFCLTSLPLLTTFDLHIILHVVAFKSAHLSGESTLGYFFKVDRQKVLW